MLLPGNRFPDIRLPVSAGKAIALPRDVAGFWAYVLFYRGGW